MKGKGGMGGERGSPGARVVVPGPKNDSDGRDRGGDGCVGWAGNVEGLGVLEAEVRCKLGEGSSVGYGVQIRGETITWESLL